MGNEKPPEKIGIGPSGRLGGLIPFIVFTIVGILIFVYCISSGLYTSSQDKLQAVRRKKLSGFRHKNREPRNAY